VVSSGDAPVAEEVPVAFVYNQRPHVVMMATPDDFEDFAVGFSLSEEIAGTPNDVQRVEVVRHSQGVDLEITVPAEAGERLATRGRQLAGNTGCGLCGVETISEALREPRTVTWREPVDPAALWRAEADLGARQEYNRATGAMHAAAWCTFDGAIRVVREDVGRHNALDKVIGALAREHVDASTGFLIMTSRASYELVQKAAVAGVPLLAAVSRPTGLAIRLAEAANVTLIGLLRGHTANVYAHPEHVRGAVPPAP
ncbi:MAG: formate dehydrogenase accessory sulfurtransferase FdhD, partial [Gemmatimonadaceae bacterium]